MRLDILSLQLLYSILEAVEECDDGTEERKDLIEALITEIQYGDVGRF